MHLQSLKDNPDVEFDDELNYEKIHSIVSNMPSKEEADEGIKQMFEKLRDCKHYNGKTSKD